MSRHARTLKVNVIDSDGSWRAYLEGSMHSIVAFMKQTYPGCKLVVAR